MTFYDLFLIYIAGYLSLFLKLKHDLKVHKNIDTTTLEILKISILSWIGILVYLYYYVVAMIKSKRRYKK